MAERLTRDIFPAEVTIDGEISQGLRVFVTDERLLAYRAASGGVIEIALNLALATPSSVPASRSSLHGHLEAKLADGRTAWINRGRGCGCGSPLKALGAPFTWTGR